MKEYLFVLLASLPLVTPWTARNTVAETDCTVLAWVRAQDLAPDFISRGVFVPDFVGTLINTRKGNCASK